MVDLTRYQNLLKEAKKQASSSDTYYSAAPTSKDKFLQTRMENIKSQMESAKQAALRKEYYGDEPTSPDQKAPQPKEGFFKRGISALQMPLYGVAGIAESIAGKGTEKNVFSNVVSNIKEEEGFGSLLRKSGVSGPISTIGGFALDVALDPVNWLTVGTSALIPRVAVGATKAGVEGAMTGLKTGLLEKGLTLAKPVKWFAPESKAAVKLAEVGTGLASKKSYYNTLTGQTLEKALQDKGVIGNVADKLIEEAGKTEAGKKVGEFYEKFLEYSPTKWYQKQKQLANTSGMRELFAEGDPEKLGAIEQVYNKFKESGSISKDFDNTFQQFKDAGYNINQLVKKNASDIINDGAKLATNDSNLARIIDGDVRLSAMRDEYLDDLSVKMSLKLGSASGLSEEALKGGLAAAREAQTATGVGWYDKTAQKIKEMSFAGDKIKAQSIVDGYKAYIDVFKSAKIGGNLATHVMSVVGNAVMAGMYGLKFWEPSFLGSVKSAKKLLSGKAEMKTVADLFTNPDLMKMVEDYPDVMRAVYGVDLKTMLTKSGVDHVIEQFAAPKLTTGLTAEKRAAVMEKFKAQGQKALSDALAKVSEEGMSPFKSVLQGSNKIDTTFISNELRSKYFSKMVENLRMQSEKGNVGAKALYWYFTKPMQAFEKIDQSYKLGTAIHLMNKGVSEGELKILSRFFPVKLGEDVFLDAATGLYKFSPDSATGLVQDMYMNYAAMPAAVKVLRSVPFLGSPFASFSFAMLNKGIKTAAYNPAFFNNVQFALNEINGGRSPLEKMALEKPYYSWYNKTGMVSLPFFRDNPVYLNAASFLPYLTMNIFEPSERKYSTGVGSTAAKLFDASPFFKDPAGQIMMDYLIMPHLLRESTPTNMWGGQMWPSDASTAQKVGYSLRSAAETILPPSAGVLGVVTPEAVMEVAPLYRWRQIGYATEGKSSVGIKGKESKTSRTTRAILSTYAGINLYPLNITYNK